MTYPIQSTEDFISKFELTGSEFYDAVRFIDSKVGFSIKRKYPASIRYKPALKSNGEPDNVVTIWLGYTHPDETSREIDQNHVPIRIRVGNMSLYRTYHIDYDFTDDNCPTKISLEESNATPKPIELEYNNEFFYNHQTNQFINGKGNNISGIDILNQVFKDHCNTVHLWKGLKLRLKLSAQSRGYGFLGIVISILKVILKYFFGRTIDEDPTSSSLYYGYKKKDFKKLNEDSLNIFGYKAAKPIILVFCLIVISISLYRYFFQISAGYISYIASNNTSTIAHGIFILWFLDSIIPPVIFRIINLIIKLRLAIASKKLKI